METPEHTFDMKPSVYIETTIPSYLTARPTRDIVMSARQQITREWWETRRQKFDCYISQLVLDECSAGDPEAADRRLNEISDLVLLTASDAVSALAHELLRRELIPAKAADDATHIAMAAAHGMDYLLTWNFSRIANAAKASAIRLACETAGFICPVICTPEELLEESS